MKFKQDFVITVAADTREHVFWTVRHKGEHIIVKNREDYEIIASMFEDVLKRIKENNG